MNSDELKAAIKALPPMDPVKPGHNWRFWAYDLRQNILNNDPNEFLTWPGVVGTMFVGNAPYIDYEISQLPVEYRDFIIESGIGKPVLYDAGNYASSGNIIHQAYHLSRWERYQPPFKLWEIDTIIEIGGGYGTMAMLVHRLGFTGRYIIYDLPEFSLLQQFYLSQNGIDCVEFATQIDRVMPCDLLIGLYSLSEMPLHTRETILSLCQAKSYLLAYQANWGERDNIAWAADVMRIKATYKWHNWNIPHLPNSWYLVGSDE
jgi:hypothetical protein